MTPPPRVHCILVTHSVSPVKLLASLTGNKDEIFLQTFIHGSNREFNEEIIQLASAFPGQIHPFGLNRGLAKSWNDGAKLAFEHGAEFIVFLNDDLFFYESGFKLFTDFCSNSFSIDPDLAIVFVQGLESGGSPLSGSVRQQGFSCCGVSRKAFDKVGCFDENFFPAYYEDVDFARRCSLAGMRTTEDTRVLVEHERSSTLRANPKMSEKATFIIESNRAYFVSKWGGDDGHAVYNTPFNSASFSQHIEFPHRSEPYGSPYDRTPGPDVAE